MNKKLPSLISVSVLALALNTGIARSQTLLGSTNHGELVEIDLDAATITLIGVEDSPDGWTDIAFSPGGELFAVSRRSAEQNQLSGLYRIDPASGEVLQQVGGLGIRFISDIAFEETGTLLGNRWEETLIHAGGLITINTTTAAVSVPGNLGFDPSNPTGDCFPCLQNGGLAVHPGTGDLWAVESDYGYSDHVGLYPEIFRVDPANGVAMGPILTLGDNGSPSTFGFDALEVLADGRFIGTRAGRSSTVALYEIDPTPSAAGLAEVTLIPLAVDPAITGHLNGLASHSPQPEQLLQSLAAQVMAFNLANGISNSLDAKLDSALNALDDLNINNDAAAVNSLYAFINSVEAQRGNQLTSAEADALVASAEAVIAAILAGG